MGRGSTVVNVTFLPKAKTPDFDVAVRIDETQMAAMNDVWLAHGNFDVVNGLFSLYAEVGVRNGEVHGYIKPMFRGMKAYDERQDRDKGFFRRLRERLIDVAAWILENGSRDEVATRVTISGRIDSPAFSAWEAVAGFLRNAFIEALQPGLEPKAGRHAR